MLSELDEVLKTILESEDVTTEMEDEYYNLFLNSAVYTPVEDLPENGEVMVLEEDTSMTPWIIEANGNNYVMLFDSLERIRDWIGDEEVGVVELKGGEVIEIFGAQYPIVLNVKSDYPKEFSVEELEMLVGSLERGTKQ